MRTIVRTMLAAAAGAALVAGGTTVIRLSDPAIADTAGATTTASDATARAGLVPQIVGDARPAAPAPEVPAGVPVPEAAARVAPAPVEQSPTPRANRAAPAPAAPALAPAAPAQPGPEPESSGTADASGGSAPSRSDDDSPSLLGGLTEPLGVSCSGSLLGSVC